MPFLGQSGQCWPKLPQLGITGLISTQESRPCSVPCSPSSGEFDQSWHNLGKHRPAFRDFAPLPFRNDSSATQRMLQRAGQERRTPTMGRNQNRCPGKGAHNWSPAQGALDASSKMARNRLRERCSADVLDRRCRPPDLAELGQLMVGCWPDPGQLRAGLDRGFGLVSLLPTHRARPRLPLQEWISVPILGSDSGEFAPFRATRCALGRSMRLESSLFRKPGAVRTKLPQLRKPIGIRSACTLATSEGNWAAPPPTPAARKAALTMANSHPPMLESTHKREGTHTELFRVWAMFQNKSGDLTQNARHVQIR